MTLSEHIATLQHTATHCNALQHATTHLTHCNTVSSEHFHVPATRPEDTTPHCNTLQHTATHQHSRRTCCNVLKCVLVRCSVLQPHHLWGRRRPSVSVLQRAAVRHGVVQRVAASSSMGASEAKFEYMSQCNPVCDSTLQCAAVCCSVLQPHLPWGRRRPSLSTCHSAIQCVAVCYSVLQCVAECCSRTFRGGVGGQVSQDPQQQARKSVERLSHPHSHPAGSKKKLKVAGQSLYTYNKLETWGAGV